MTISTLFNIGDKVIVTPNSASAWDKKIYVVGKIEYNSEDATVYYYLNLARPANPVNNAVSTKGFLLKIEESALQAATVELVTQLFDTTAAAEKAALLAQLGE